MALKAQAIDLDAWVEASKPRWLRIADINALAPGESLEVLFLDRNLGDHVMDPARHTPNTPYKATHFFKTHKAVYVHKAGSQGALHMPWDVEPCPFSWEVEYAPDSWYPLNKQGELPLLSADTGQRLEVMQPHGTGEPEAGRSWNTLSAETHVGWRGPMIRWSDVETLPPVFWVDLPPEAWFKHAEVIEVKKGTGTGTAAPR